MLDLKKYGSFYAYREIKGNSKLVEFGWVLVKNLEPGELVFSKSTETSEGDGLATLKDYEKYFNKLTGLSPSAFLDKWRDSPVEYRAYWYTKYPKTDFGTHEFILKLADLICNKKTFEHKFSKRTTTYKVMDVSDEAEGISAGDKN